MLNAFSSTQKILTKKEFGPMHFKDKVNLFFIDADLIPMLV